LALSEPKISLHTFFPTYIDFSSFWMMPIYALHWITQRGRLVKQLEEM
jgi:hypothetical protein